MIIEDRNKEKSKTGVGLEPATMLLWFQNQVFSLLPTPVNLPVDILIICYGE
jgi:hypothetical protein